MSRWLGLLAVAVLLAGCSHAAAKPPPESLASVAADLGCTYTPYGGQEEIFTAESGACGPYVLYRFHSEKEKRTWLQVSEGYVTIVKQGPTWLVVEG